jgi:hypothetical protein
MMDEVQKPCNPECSTPSSEPFIIYIVFIVQASQASTDLLSTWCIAAEFFLASGVALSQEVFFLFLFGSGAIGTAATPGLLCQPPVIVNMIVEKQMECRLAGETEVLGENPPQRHFCPSQNPT